MAVVGGGLAVRVQERRGVARLLEEANRPLAHVRELALRQAALAAEGGGASVVLGEQRHHLVRPPLVPLLEERAHLEVLPRADGLGQHPVRHVADQHVLERELALGVGLEDVLLAQRPERLPEVAPLRLGDGGERVLPERAPDDGRLLHEPPLERLERVEPGGQHGLHGVGQLGGVAAALLGDAAGHLLGEERIAAGALGHGGDHVLALGQQGAEQLAGVRLGERVEQQLGGRAASAAPAGPPVEQLVAGEADQHQRRAHPLGEVLDGVEHAVVGPVDVLEHEHQRPAPGDRLDPRAQRREEGLAQALRVGLGRHELGGHVESEQAADQGGLAARRRRWPRRRRRTGRRRSRRACPRPRRPSRSRRSRTRRAAPRRAPSRRSPSRRAGSGRCERWAARAARPGAARTRAAAATCPRRPRRRASRAAASPRAPPARRAIRARPARRSRPTSGDSLAGPARPQRVLGDQAVRLPGRHRLGLALQLERLELAGSRSPRWVARIVRSPTVTLPGRAALCSRAATFTVSPITV